MPRSILIIPPGSFVLTWIFNHGTLGTGMSVPSRASSAKARAAGSEAQLSGEIYQVSHAHGLRASL